MFYIGVQFIIIIIIIIIIVIVIIIIITIIIIIIFIIIITFTSSKMMFTLSHLLQFKIDYFTLTIKTLRCD